MADSTLREAIRIVLETEGRDGVDALRKALEGVGDVSASTVADTDRLLDSLIGLNDAAAKAARFEQMTADLAGTTEALDEASRAALQLGLQLKETTNPSKEMQRTYQQVRDEVTRLESVQRQQAATADKAGAELRAQGVDTASLAVATQKLRTQIEGTTTALQKQVGVVERESASTRAHKAAVLEQDAAFRKMAKSGQVSADALARYRNTAEGAADGTRRLAGESGRLSGIFSGLRGAIAPVLGYLTLRGATEGIKNLLRIGAAAETAQNALGNLYGSQEAGNRAFDALKQLAKDSGLSLQAVLEDAKKLKAFGLDPLSGAYQALVDQNAAVGGSQEDLSGKVLALGQAWAKQKLQGEEILQLVERGVPVWDLLQKATGKSVAELQKLSEQGALGRDVITALYKEIGRANEGAATRGLSSLTGLLAQVTARWQEFVGKIADSGVTDWFKRQVGSLLGSTGDLDAIAKRIGAVIVNTLDALKRLGSQIALIASPIANATVAIGRHAEAILFLGKVYVALKLTRVASEFLNLAKAQGIATAATQAAAAAEASRAVGVGRLSGLIASLPKTIGIGILVAGLDFTLNQFIKLNEALEYRRDALNKIAGFERAERELQQEQLKLGQQLQDLYRAGADTIVQSGDRIAAMTREQASEYQAALERARQYFGGVIREARATGDAQREAAASERWHALGDAIDAVRERMAALARGATAEPFKLLAAAAVESFDEVVTKTKDVKTAVSDIFAGVDFTQADGLKQAISIIDQMNARGVAAGKAVKEELRSALAGVANDDLPRLKAAADDAFGSGSAGAKAFAAEVDRINFARLGVDIEEIKTGFSAAGKVAVDNFRGAIAEVDKLALTAEQRSRAIAQAFDNAFKSAGTRAEVQALQKSLEEALHSGDISFQQFQQRAAQTTAKLAELGGQGKAMGDQVADGADKASASIDEMGQAASTASHGVDKVAKSSEKAGEAASKSVMGLKEMSFSLGSVSQEAAEAYSSLNRIAAFGDQWINRMNRVTSKLREQQDELQQQNAELDKQLAALDPMTKEVEKLRAQYNFVDDATLRAIAEKRQRLEDERARVAKERQQLADEQRKAEDQQVVAATSGSTTEATTTSVSVARAIAPATGAGGVLATLRVQVVGGGTHDLEVDPTSARGFIDELTRSASTSQIRRSPY